MCAYQYLNSKITDNLSSKVQIYNSFSSEGNEPKIVIFSDKYIGCHTMWRDVFRVDVELILSTRLDLIPLPDNYQPVQYNKFVDELNKYMKTVLATDGLIWGVFNFGTKETPLFNLVLAERKIRKTELAFEVKPHVTKASAPKVDAVSIGMAAGEEATFDLKVCKALGVDGPHGSREYARSMNRLRKQIASTIEECTDAQDTYKQPATNTTEARPELQ